MSCLHVSWWVCLCVYGLWMKNPFLSSYLYFIRSKINGMGDGVSCLGLRNPECLWEPRQGPTISTAKWKGLPLMLPALPQEWVRSSSN